MGPGQIRTSIEILHVVHNRTVGTEGRWVGGTPGAHVPPPDFGTWTVLGRDKRLLFFTPANL